MAKLGIPEHRAGHEGRLRRRIMGQLFWASVVVVVSMVWTYRRRPVRTNGLGSVSERWLQEHRNATHEDR
jgi:hypothetical protein